MSARLTDAERDALTKALAAAPGCWDYEPCCWSSAEAMFAAVERIFAARLAEVEAERDSLVRLMLAANSRAEEATTALADLRAAVEALADAWMCVGSAGDHGLYCPPCRNARRLRALLTQQRDGGAS